MTSIDTNNYRSHCRATIEHGGLPRDAAFGALEQYLPAQASWFVFQRDPAYWFVHPIGGRRCHFGVMLTYDSRDLIIDVRQNSAK